MLLIRFIRWFGRRSVHLVGFYSLMAGCAAAGLAAVGDIPWWVDGAILTVPILLWVVCAWAIQTEGRR